MCGETQMRVMPGVWRSTAAQHRSCRASPRKWPRHSLEVQELLNQVAIHKLSGGGGRDVLVAKRAPLRMGRQAAAAGGDRQG